MKVSKDCKEYETKHKKELLKMSKSNLRHGIETVKLAKEEAKAAKPGKSTKPMKPSKTMKMGKY